MNRQRLNLAIVLATCLLSMFAPVRASHAGFADELKKKLADKAAQKAARKASQPGTASGTAAGDTTAAEKGAATANPTGSAAGSVSSVSTKFDFVPGDSVILIDDFKLDDLGEFPARWQLAGVTFEVAEMEGERWLRCNSVDGIVRMKLAPMSKLPEFWTLAFDFYATEPMGSALIVRALGKDGSWAWSATYSEGDNLAFRTGEIISTTPLEGATTPAGRHHVMIMARGTALKVYLDRQRMANAPDISTAAGMPNELEIRLWASTHPMITNVRFAEGCRPAKDLLDQGKLITYGIRFATGSDVVLPESAPILRQISAYLVAHPDAKLKVVGHTDNVGTAASNLALSKRRAASVARVLGDQFGIVADRLTTDGKGDTQALSSNAKPEGRAMNRRVEFTKL